MKSPLLQLCLCTLLGLLGLGCNKTDSPAKNPDTGTEGWKILNSTPQSNERFDDIFFINEFSGWICSDAGEVYHTSDGGNSWTFLAKKDSIWFRCIGFANAQKGWIGNLNHGNNLPGKALFETTDSGLTWSNISGRIQGVPVPALCGIWVVNENTVFALGRWSGPAVFVKTLDSGTTWISTDMSSLASGLVDAYFFNENEGFVVGTKGDVSDGTSQSIILFTDDAGQTWQSKYLGDHIGEFCWKIQFVGRDVGYVSTEGANAEGAIIKTIDGGQSWTRIKIGDKVQLEGIGFISPDRGWVGCSPTGDIYSTSDGGQSWRKFNLGKGINRMRVINSKLIFASGGDLGAQVYKWTP